MVPESGQSILETDAVQRMILFFFIGPLFVLPRYQNQGLGYAAIQKAFAMFPGVKVWRLDTILQEPGNCHLYEKCGFVRTGEESVVNDRMTLIDYELKR